MSDPDRTIPESANAANGEPALGPGARVGRYLILNKVGAGNMGIVFAAFDPELDRKVAIKLLRGDAHGHAGRTRLRREAQALARLGHPNVVAVHDVGELDGRVYLVMEFVAGEDVRRWQSRRPSWREVVRVYVQAGHGLAAAHSAGLVHRDFKPANVMFGDDDRVRVTDFGLARAAPEADGPFELVESSSALEPPPPVLSPPESNAHAWLDRLRRTRFRRAPAPPTPLTSPNRDALASSVTRAGALVGTPAYMAHEQFEGAAADARSDQFAFCVAFYEALYGRRPFAGDSLDALVTALERNQIRPPLRGVGVPAWLHAVLIRGLNCDPEQRWPTMDALLEAIERAPVKRRRWKAIAVAAALTTAGATLGLTQAAEPGASAEVCSGAEGKLAEVWNSTDRERMRIAFAASGRPFAADTLARVERELDAYTRAWARMYVDACEATHLRWAQSDAVLDQRMRCLERNRRELSALVDALAGANPDIVERAVAAAEGLTPIERCGDVEALASELPVPRDHGERLRADAIRDELTDATALEATGQVEAAEKLTATLLDEALALGYAPLVAEVEYQLGDLVRHRGAFEDARELLESAYYTALGEGHTRLASAAAVELIDVLGSGLAQIERAHEWLRNAEALAQSLGGDRLALARIERYRMTLLIQGGRYDEALEVGRGALEVIEILAGPNSFDAAAVHSDLGATLVELGRFAAAETALRRAAQILEIQLGADHPRVALLLANLGAVQSMTGRTDDAIATYHRSIELLTRAYGPDHPALGALHVNLGLARQVQGDDEAALRELDEALRLFERELGAMHPKVAAALRGIAEVELELRHARSAEAAARRSLFVLESSLDADHPELSRARVLLGQTLLAQGRHDEAEAELLRALAVLEAEDPPDAVRLAFALQTRGQLELERGQLDAARVLLERALVWWEPSDPSTERARGLAVTRLALARALVELDEPERATELAQLALAELDEGPNDARLRRTARRLRALTR
ncbi:Serine/threonine-protein kinase StkP [Enhygromyxa salina]|uniref:Serine/threonine-protein kinase StkP n=1 Tax=Enhygromyxa salina TaxID=215803 RepID=A0A2S9XVM5_9BACT|nr:serine/threonine-protein kinase [Enhygromyxa salina]PRP96761.1 Serine/threonine-protein kinase StkP [Enhygromyxa salina]